MSPTNELDEASSWPSSTAHPMSIGSPRYWACNPPPEAESRPNGIVLRHAWAAMRSGLLRCARVAGRVLSGAPRQHLGRRKRSVHGQVLDQSIVGDAEPVPFLDRPAVQAMQAGRRHMI